MEQLQCLPMCSVGVRQSVCVRVQIVTAYTGALDSSATRAITVQDADTNGGTDKHGEGFEGGSTRLIEHQCNPAVEFVKSHDQPTYIVAPSPGASNEKHQSCVMCEIA